MPLSLSYSDRALALDVNIPGMVPDSVCKDRLSRGLVPALLDVSGAEWKSGRHNQKATHSSRSDTEINSAADGVHIQKEP